MWARRFETAMDEWKPLDFTSEETPSAPHESVVEGLSTDATTLQGHFDSMPTHLSEVRARTRKCWSQQGCFPRQTR